MKNFFKIFEKRRFCPRRGPVRAVLSVENLFALQEDVRRTPCLSRRGVVRRKKRAQRKTLADVELKLNVGKHLRSRQERDAVIATKRR